MQAIDFEHQFYHGTLNAMTTTSDHKLKTKNENTTTLGANPNQGRLGKLITFNTLGETK